MRRSKSTPPTPPATYTVGHTEGELESIPEEAWKTLQQRAAILRSFGDVSMTHAQARRAGQQLGVHWTTAYRWRKRLLEGELVTALQDRARGFPARYGRLSAGQESVVAQVVNSRLGRASGTRGVDLVEEVMRRCVRASITTPSRRAIERRWMRSLAGLPRCLHLDNAPEFHSKALLRGCAQFGIELVWRPVGRPHFGGHVERGIGTLMSRFKSLPGATGSNTVERRGRQRPEKTATMTLGELERWLAVEIAQRYHHRPHKGLQGATPHSLWTASPPAVLSPTRQEALPWAFLPAVSRTLRRDGLHLHNIRYWHPVFAQWAVLKPVVLVHYDPRDLSQLYVRAEGETLLAVPYAGLQHPAVSVWECVAAARHLRQLGEPKVREARLFAAIEEQRRIVAKAASKTRSARAKQQRRVQHQGVADAAKLQARAPVAPAPASDEEAGEYPGEVW